MNFRIFLIAGELVPQEINALQFLINVKSFKLTFFIILFMGQLNEVPASDDNVLLLTFFLKASLPCFLSLSRFCAHNVQYSMLISLLLRSARLSGHYALLLLELTFISDDMVVFMVYQWETVLVCSFFRYFFAPLHRVLYFLYEHEWIRVKKLTRNKMRLCVRIQLTVQALI